jgi:tRNA1(Val) A37 N6-methylase TrmN6
MVGSLEGRKRLGQVFTPDKVASTLVRWVIRRKTDRLLDPSCGDGRFLAFHSPSTGIELDPCNTALARERVPDASIYRSEFFEWASNTTCRFEAAAGNPPFIRYQHFAGKTRQLALELAQKLGADINGLASSWASFLVVTAGLLKAGGRMAFVVPAEIGHAPYASPVLEYLCSQFQQVRIVAIRDKLFPSLSEAAWLLFADGFGGRTKIIELSLFDRFTSFTWTDQPTKRVTVSSWQHAGCHLRKFLLPDDALSTYQSIASEPGVRRLGELASTSIGYVSGANDFFHLRPSDVERYHIPRNFLRTTIRRSRQLPAECVDRRTVKCWLSQDEPVMLLDLTDAQELPSAVIAYLNSERGWEVRKGYKCRNRDPWYAIPDIRVPDAFLSYMSGRKPTLVRNEAGCVCTNSVHAVFKKNQTSLRAIQRAWRHVLVDLSCELEGHPLGGGILKLEPREASNVLIPIGNTKFVPSDVRLLEEATSKMREWRNYA